MELHREIIQLLIAYTLVGALMFTVIITCLSLVGWIRLANQRQQGKLFTVLIIELVSGSVAFFFGFIQLNPKRTVTEVGNAAVLDRQRKIDELYPAVAAAESNQPLGIRNNNPLNVAVHRIAFQGQTGVDSKGIAIFKGPEWGIRAAALSLLRAQDMYHQSTLAELSNWWAPGNNEYLSSISKQLGIQPGTKIDLHDQQVVGRLVRAMIVAENVTQPYSDSVIEYGLLLSGIEPKKSDALGIR